MPSLTEANIWLLDTASLHISLRKSVTFVPIYLVTRLTRLYQAKIHVLLLFCKNICKLSYLWLFSSLFGFHNLQDGISQLVL
jgi:hypothetical protein